VKKVLLLLVLIAGALVFSAKVPGRTAGAYHDFTGRCLDCHIKIPGAGDKKPTLRKDITGLCMECHRQEEGLTHPVDITPAMKVPSYFPLDWRGMVTCLTCHEIHHQGFGPSHLRTSAGGQGFCVLCHSGLDDNMIHTLSGVNAHIGGAPRPLKASYSPQAQGGARLDEMSIKCLSCHDAIVGSSAMVENQDIFRSRHSNITGLTHPVGVSYAEAKRKYRGAYRDMASLPPQIKFFGGMVGCGTCHSPYSGTHAQLVMDNYGSNLCLACHVK